ncbi:MAG: PAS domain S-box protein [Bacilli bacterium]|nr:PAS domain S-box protein [Bacilli bacterium]
MNSSSFNKIINFNDIGYALCEIVYDDTNKPINFLFIETSKIFQEIFGVISLSKQHSGEEIILRSNKIINPVNVYNDIMHLLKRKKEGKVDIYFNSGDDSYSVDVLIEDNKRFLLVLNKSNVIDKILFDKNVYYHTLVNSMNDLIFLMNLDFTIVYVSPSIKNVIGYTEKELIGKNLGQVVSEENYNIIKRAYERGLESNRDNNWLVEITQTHKKGKLINMEYMARFLKDDSGRLIGIMCLGRDITTWVKAKKEIKENQESLALLLDSTAEGIFGLDNRGNITFVNKSCLSLLGYKNNKELIGKPIQVIMGMDYIENIFLERFESVFERGMGHYYEIDQFLKADGSNFIAEYYVYPQRSNEKIVGSVVTFFDITERVRTENDLYESERSKSVLLTNLPGLAYRCELDEKYTLRFVSEGCFDLTGYPPEALLNNRDLSFNDIILPKYRDYLWKKWNSLIGTNELFKEEYELLCADGTTKWVLEQGQIVYDNNKNAIALEGIIIDINEQKLKQAEIEYLSYYDSLTGLNNRASFENKKKEYINDEYMPLSLIIGDINGLKLINDAIGHKAGDKILVQASNLIREVAGEYFITRTGGDEFAILLPNTDADEAYKVMKAIVERADEYNNNVKNELQKINLALGFATMESTAQDYTEISALAEDYMYKRKLNDRLSFHSNIIASIRSTMFERSQMTEEHAERLKEYSQMLGNALNLSQVQLDELALVSTLHDIGKIGIEDGILNKSGKLTDEEWAEMKKHPEIGYRICMTSPELMSIAPYVLHHHERWDGNGYPSGIKGEDIPLLARIIAVVDAFDAMTEDRPYRKAKSCDYALEEILANAGTQFDPKIAKLFVQLMRNKK